MNFCRCLGRGNVNIVTTIFVRTRDFYDFEIRICKSSCEKIVEDFEGNIDKEQRNALVSFSKEEQLQLSKLLGKYMNQYLSQDKNIDLICLRCNGKINDE